MNKKRIEKFEKYLEELELFLPEIPLCKCGCGEQLNLPSHFLDIKYNITMSTVKNYIAKRQFLNGHIDEESKKQKEAKRVEGVKNRYQEKRNNCKTLSAEIKGLIYGTLLGDTSILFPYKPDKYKVNPRLVWNHCLDQKDWSEYKADRLVDLGVKVEVRSNLGFGEFWSRGVSKCLYSLMEIKNTVSPMGKKIVTKNWLENLSEEGVAWWFMDDGSADHRPKSSSLIFHTEGFSYEENVLIKEWFQSKSIETVIRKYKGRNGYYYIALNKKASEIFIDRYSKYSIPSMNYKFGI